MFQKGVSLIDSSIAVFKKVEADLNAGISHLEEENAYHANIIIESSAKQTENYAHISRAKKILDNVKKITT